jgi:peptidoglycan/xylan/chitin deacetylase (PgdA/CDA1 family)
MFAPYTLRSSLAVLVLCACSSYEPARLPLDAADAAVQPDASPDAASSPDAPEQLAATVVTPTLGSVEGGTEVWITGHALLSATHVSIGPYDCAPITHHSNALLSCLTPTTQFHEGTFDVVVTNGAETVTLPQAFTYECPWMTSQGRRSCGAMPAPDAGPQLTSTWISQLQAGHGFTANADGAGTSNLADTTDFTIGTQSVWVETDGAGTLRDLRSPVMAPMDLTNQDVKIWIKVDDVAHLASAELLVGDATLANAFRFKLRSSQGQQWITNGDWVSFAIPWAASNYSLAGTPARTAITRFALRFTDDATGTHVRLHVNALATVAEPVAAFPKGVISFTFDDNYASMVDVGATALATHGFAGTSYVITDMVDKPARASLTALHDLQTAGWDISVHASTDVDHATRYPNLTAAQVEDDMVDARAWLMTNGFAGYNHCAYPGGAFKTDSNAVLDLAAKYFTSCRTIYQRQQETYLPSDAAKLRVLYVTSDVPLATVQQRVDEACASHEWLIVVFHQLVAGTPSVSTEWNAGDFTQLVDYVAATGIPVRPVSAVLGP